jgi:tRNA(Ile)-lysidine synthase
MLPNVRDDRQSDFKQRFAAAMAALDLSDHPALITALSGGPDSTALALLAQNYAEETGKAHHAVIIDHGLRGDSAAESARVRNRLARLGVASRIMRIDAPKPPSAIQEWARRHRHALLAEAARPNGAAVLFGHHAGDQAETVAMRLGRGSGLAGLAGIPVRRQHAGVTFARPLLGWPSSSTRAVCAAFGCAFETDPSNDSGLFERVRVRQNLARLNRDAAAGGVTSSKLIRLARAAGRLTEALNQTSAPLIARALTLHPSGHAEFTPALLAGLPQSVWWHIMRQVIVAIGGGEYAPSQAAGAECRCRVEAGLSTTLGQCHFHPRRHHAAEADPASGPAFLLFRETGRRLILKPVLAGQQIDFAGCWQVRSAVNGFVHAFADRNRTAEGLGGGLGDGLGEGLAAGGDWPALPDAWRKLPHRARQAIPVVTGLDGRRFYPHLKGAGLMRDGVAVTARHLGMAKPPIFFAD